MTSLRTLTASHTLSTLSQISSSSSIAQSRFHIGPLSLQNSRCSGGALLGSERGTPPGTSSSEKRSSRPMRFMSLIGWEECSESRYSGVIPPWTNDAAAWRNGFGGDAEAGYEGSPRKRRSEEPRGVEGRTGAARSCGTDETRYGTRAVME